MRGPTSGAVDQAVRFYGDLGVAAGTPDRLSSNLHRSGQRGGKDELADRGDDNCAPIGVYAY